MRVYLTFILLLFSTMGWAQKVVDEPNMVAPSKKSYERRSTIVTLSVGIHDAFKSGYSLPDSFVHQYTKGFSPLYLRVEHAFTDHIGVAVNVMYDKFYYNYTKAPNYTYSVYTYNDKVVVFNAGIAGYYHFRNLFPKVPQLDVFAGVGASLSQVQHSYGITDTSSSVDINPKQKTESIFAPMIKIGARYYVDRNISLYGDLGYDKISVLSIGVSYRIL